MPIPVAPGTSAPSVPVVGSDGVLTATVAPSLAAVLLTVRFDHLTGTNAAMTVTVARTVGATGNVRGLDQHPAPKGVTAGIDAEVPLGVPVTFVATARSAAGATWTSQPVQVTVPLDRSRGWIKSLTDPGLSVRLSVESYPDWQRAQPLAVFRPFNRPDPVTRFGVRQFATGQMSVHALTVAEQVAVDALLLSSGPMLVQVGADQTVARPDVYVAVGEDTFSQPAPDPTYRGVSFPVTRIARPSTAGSVVRLPGRSWDSVRARYASWDAVKAANTSWLDLLTS